MCLLKWCCCGCTLSTAIKATLLVDFLWVGFYGIWAILSTIFLKTVGRINTNYYTDNPDDQYVVTTLLWSILIVSLTPPLIGLIALFTNFKARQVLAYLISRILAECGHFGLFLCYLSYIGSKDLIGTLITFCWLAVCLYLNWVLLSYFFKLVSLKKKKKSSFLEITEEKDSKLDITGFRESKSMFVTSESFIRKIK